LPEYGTWSNTERNKVITEKKMSTGRDNEKGRIYKE
jgi:hypothetical protein